MGADGRTGRMCNVLGAVRPMRGVAMIVAARLSGRMKPL